MRLASKDTVAGLPAAQARQLMREVRVRHPEGMPVTWIAKALSTDVDEATNVVKLLEADGFVVPSPEGWTTTIQGNALANVRFTKPSPRAKAQVHLDGLLARAAEVNANEQLLHDVTRIVLFGSFLDPAIDPVGDVDLVVTLTRRHLGREVMEEKTRQFNELMDHRSTGILDYLFYPENWVKTFLKNRSSVLAIIWDDDPVLEITAHKVIFEV